ncbi:TPA: DUF968 domain-containing protein [Escherichia coli]|nr:DUF968 domain-containing protein [Escherichia coli]
MSLLMTSQPIVINRDLACRIGLNEAIVLQQLHYWLNETNSGTEHAVAFEEKYGSQLELIFRFIDRALAIGVLA